MLIDIEKAAFYIAEGNPIAVPTDTVYGFASAYHDIEAVKKIYHLKGRPSSSPLIILIADKEELSRYVKTIPPIAHVLIERFWPGSLTLIFEANSDLIPQEVRSEGSTIGIRIPNHLTLRELIRKTGPLVVTSANKTGFPSAITSKEIEKDFGSDFPILDSDEPVEGTASTIVRFQDGVVEVLREGFIAKELKKINFLLHTVDPVD
jgi:L-threonylcarbamoyladenylate synthase